MEHLQQWLSGELELSWAGRGSPQPYPSTAARLLPLYPCPAISSALSAGSTGGRDMLVSSPIPLFIPLPRS